MSIATIKTIMGRIQAASKESPIAVIVGRDGELDAFFANTIIGKMNCTHSERLVGVFHRKMPVDEVRAKLVDAVRKHKKTKDQTEVVAA